MLPRMHEAVHGEQVSTSRRALLLAAAGCAIGVACGAGSDASSAPGPAPTAAPPAEHVATADDFAGFRSWERIPIEGAAVPTKARPGAVAVYARRRAPAGATAWPLGTAFVKAVESGDDPRDWTVHAMVKRGGDFNRAGYGWEFFGLQLTEDGRPVILWRTEGDNDGHAYSSGLSPGITVGMAPDVELSCNDCHGNAWQDDTILTPALSLRAALSRP